MTLLRLRSSTVPPGDATTPVPNRTTHLDGSVEARELPPSTLSPAARVPSFYKPELDALRFLAFLMVFISHCPLGNSLFGRMGEAGAFGVGVFFCLSAYLIVTLLLRERDRTGTIRLRAFAVRRMLRIWPLYFLVIGACCLCGLGWPAARLDGHMLLALSLMYANV